MSLWKRFQRVGKKAAKFKFIVTYQELTLEYDKKWTPNSVCIIWCRRNRKIISQWRKWEPSLDNPFKGVVSWPIPEIMEFEVTLYRDPRDPQVFEDKEWTIFIEDRNLKDLTQPSSKRQQIAASADLRLNNYIGSICGLEPKVTTIRLPLRPNGKRVREAVLKFTISCTFLKEGKATDEDMYSLASVLQSPTDDSAISSSNSENAANMARTKFNSLSRLTATSSNSRTSSDRTKKGAPSQLTLDELNLARDDAFFGAKISELTRDWRNQLGQSENSVIPSNHVASTVQGHAANASPELQSSQSNDSSNIPSSNSNEKSNNGMNEGLNRSGQLEANISQLPVSRFNSPADELDKWFVTPTVYKNGANKSDAVPNNNISFLTNASSKTADTSADDYPRTDGILESHLDDGPNKHVGKDEIYDNNATNNTGSPLQTAPLTHKKMSFFDLEQVSSIFAKCNPSNTYPLPDSALITTQKLRNGIEVAESLPVTTERENVMADFTTLNIKKVEEPLNISTPNCQVNKFDATSFDKNGHKRNTITNNNNGKGARPSLESPFKNVNQKFFSSLRLKSANSPSSTPNGQPLPHISADPHVLHETRGSGISKKVTGKKGSGSIISLGEQIFQKTQQHLSHLLSNTSSPFSTTGQPSQDLSTKEDPSAYKLVRDSQGRLSIKTFDSKASAMSDESRIPSNFSRRLSSSLRRRKGSEKSHTKNILNNTLNTTLDVLIDENVPSSYHNVPEHLIRPTAKLYHNKPPLSEHPSPQTLKYSMEQQTPPITIPKSESSQTSLLSPVGGVFEWCRDICLQQALQLTPKSETDNLAKIKIAITRKFGSPPTQDFKTGGQPINAITSNLWNLEKFRDGIVFCVLLDHYLPGKIDLKNLDPVDIEGNNRKAYQVIVDLGVVPLIEPHEMTNLKVPLDRLAVITYLYQLKTYFERRNKLLGKQTSQDLKKVEAPSTDPNYNNSFEASKGVDLARQSASPIKSSTPKTKMYNQQNENRFSNSLKNTSEVITQNSPTLDDIVNESDAYLAKNASSLLITPNESIITSEDTLSLTKGKSSSKRHEFTIEAPPDNVSFPIVRTLPRPLTASRDGINIQEKFFIEPSPPTLLDNSQNVFSNRRSDTKYHTMLNSTPRSHSVIGTKPVSAKIGENDGQVSSDSHHHPYITKRSSTSHLRDHLRSLHPSVGTNIPGNQIPSQFTTILTDRELELKQRAADLIKEARSRAQPKINHATLLPNPASRDHDKISTIEILALKEDTNPSEISIPEISKTINNIEKQPITTTTSIVEFENILRPVAFGRSFRLKIKPDFDFQCSDTHIELKPSQFEALPQKSFGFGINGNNNNGKEPQKQFVDKSISSSASKSNQHHSSNAQPIDMSSFSATVQKIQVHATKNSDLNTNKVSEDTQSNTAYVPNNIKSEDPSISNDINNGSPPPIPPRNRTSSAIRLTQSTNQNNTEPTGIFEESDIYAENFVEKSDGKYSSKWNGHGYIQDRLNQLIGGGGFVKQNLDHNHNKNQNLFYGNNGLQVNGHKEIEGSTSHFDTTANQLPLSESNYVEVIQRQKMLDEKALAMEHELRNTMLNKDSQRESVLMAEWFEIINTKNELIRQQNQITISAKEKELESKYENLKGELQSIMEIPENAKTAADELREKALIDELVEVVNQRDELVQNLDIQEQSITEPDTGHPKTSKKSSSTSSNKASKTSATLPSSKLLSRNNQQSHHQHTASLSLSGTPLRFFQRATANNGALNHLSDVNQGTTDDGSNLIDSGCQEEGNESLTGATSFGARRGNWMYNTLISTPRNALYNSLPRQLKRTGSVREQQRPSETLAPPGDFEAPKGGHNLVERNANASCITAFSPYKNMLQRNFDESSDTNPLAPYMVSVDENNGDNPSEEDKNCRLQ